MKHEIKSYPLKKMTLTGWEELSKEGSYKDLIKNPQWYQGWISFDALNFNTESNLLFCGLNSLDGDLLYTFDPQKEVFQSLNAKNWTDQFDCKIHRTLLKNPKDSCFYFGIGLLHDAPYQHQAPGGKIVKYDPSTNKFDILGIPFPHLYIQSIAADFDADLIFAFTYPAEFVVSFNIRTKVSTNLAYLGNAIMFVQPHNAVIDRHGCLWGTYAETRAWDDTTGKNPVRLFKYNPKVQSFSWFEHGLSRKSEQDQLLADRYDDSDNDEILETRHKDDFGFCDSMVFDGNRYIYAGTTAGVLCRIDIETAQVTKIANVMKKGRFPALKISSNGYLYGGGGIKGDTKVIRWDMNSEHFDVIGHVADRNNETPARIHEIAVDPQENIYLAENDNHRRASWLWKVRWQS